MGQHFTNANLTATRSTENCHLLYRCSILDPLTGLLLLALNAQETGAKPTQFQANS
jgi:hypothetical protein